MGKLLGIDLGTANTLLYVKGRGIALGCPSVVAITRETREIVAIGNKARNMLGKTPESILTVRPMKDGVIADPDVTIKMLRIFFEKAEAISFFSRPSVIAALPHGVTEVEKRAVEDAIFEAGAREVALIDEPLAAAIGAGVRIGSPRGTMLVDIGGGTTEVAVISMGGISETATLRVAGNRLDDAIVNHLRLTRNVLIGIPDAETLKIRLASAHPSTDEGELEVCGRNLRNNLAARISVSSAEIREAITPQLDNLIRTVKSTLEKTSPELSSDIYDRGILLTGGGSLIRGLPLLIRERTGLPATLAKNPLESVCRGLGRIIESEDASELLHFRGR